MFDPEFNITNSITQSLTQIERFRGFLHAVNLSETWLALMQKKALILEAYHTTHIEGTQLSLDQAKQILNDKTIYNADKDDTQELLNYRTAFEFVSSYLLDQKPINEGLIRQIHAILVQNVRGNSAMPGEYRKVQNFVVNSPTKKIIYTPPPAYDVPIMMKELIEWVNNEKAIHPVIISAIAQFQFVHIHPFLDGNGRTARLLSTLYLYKTGYDFKRLFTISEYYDRDRPAFYQAIQSVRERGMDLTGWLEFFTEGLATQLDEVKGRGERAIRRDVLDRQHGLSDRQALALDRVLNQGRI